jgi:hypothetical protein
MTFQPVTRATALRSNKSFRHEHGGLVYPRWEVDRARSEHAATPPGMEKDAARRVLLRALIRFLAAHERADLARDAAIRAWGSLPPDAWFAEDVVEVQHASGLRAVCAQALEETRLEILTHLRADDVA